MCNFLSLVCGLSVLLSILWTTGAQLDPCSGRASVVLAVPGGAGQSSKTFEDNLINLMYYFDLSENNIDIGLLLYGDNTERILSPGVYRTRKQVNTAVTLLSRRQLYYSTTLGRGQDLLKGLQTMEDMFEDVAPGVRKIGVVFTEGLINGTMEEGRDILAAAARLKESGVVMYNLGSSVSSQVGGVFEFIGTDRCRLFGLGGSWKGLSTAIPYLARGICSELDPTETVAQGNCYHKSYAIETPLETVCPVKPSYALLPDPNNCAYYYQCVPTFRRNPNYAGYSPSNLHRLFTLVYEPIRRQCGDGTLFDERGYCNHIALVSCNTD